MTNAATEQTATLHPFEKAGLGKGPFRFVGMTVKVGPIRVIGKDGLEWMIGAEGQPMGTCAYCGTGIANCCEIRSADGKDFIVGTDCVAKTYAKGEKIRTQVERLVLDAKNEKARERSAIKAKASKDRVKELLADETLRTKLAGRPSAYAWKAAEGATGLDDAEWLAAQCGHSGRVRLIKSLEKELAL